jgi:phosphatidylinositol alpha-mannosyltransferase
MIPPTSWNVDRPSLRIAVVSPGLPTAGKKEGGVDRVAHDLADGLARRGHSVTVWSYDSRPAGASYAVRQLPGAGVFHNRWGKQLTVGYMGHLFNALPGYTDQDVVVSHSDSALLPFLGLPVVRVMHGTALQEALTAKSPWRFVSQLGIFPSEVWTAFAVKATVGVSENTRRFNPFVRTVIPNGVDTQTFAPDAVAKTPFPSILFVGSLEGRKRGRLLIDWFERVIRPAHPTAVLDMVSARGPDQPGVQYHSGIDRSSLAELYRRAWVYASPSAYEGFGLPYIEAMASGTPVVATPNPGSREVLGDGAYGVLVDDGDFAMAVNRLLGDVEERFAWRVRGLERAAEFSLETMVDRYDRLIQSVVRKDRLQRRRSQ